MNKAYNEFLKKLFRYGFKGLIIKLRKNKLEEIRSKRQAFPNDFKRDSYAKELLLNYKSMQKL